MLIGELARAKVNLTLAVLGRRTDGYHELESLVTFAATSDVVTIETDAAEELTISGPSARSIVGENLLSRTIALLRAADRRLSIGSVHVDKKLPVAAGLGGGSADVAALLRAIRRANPERAKAIPWADIAAVLGSDVPVCFADHPALIWGRGERMSLVPFLPAMDAVVVNPRLPLATASVFAALKSGPAPPAVAAPAQPQIVSVAGLLDYMRARGNDLEPPACELLPVIVEIKSQLAAQPDCRFAGMSGSGPTCFGIFSSPASARHAAAAIAAARPEWWVEPTILDGAP
ncbi:MAG: 4-(cytidine 5'-diphospho)-2-C-methyl-D-erythritol kinase [Hyphomicrobiaceae bacterium]|nr:4-(cytidine 5'-diphospho)-2-C-methyl-D-erythritol kinase [Hyphomicrobiaceae bacterium]